MFRCFHLDLEVQLEVAPIQVLNNNKTYQIVHHMGVYAREE